MSDPRKELQGLFAANKRHENFGETIVKLVVDGFRCHKKTTIEIESPITVFCGQNGAGKSTLLHLVASGYRGSPPSNRYHIQKFIFVGKLDKAPFTEDAKVLFEYTIANDAEGKPDVQTLTISRGKSKWTGYKRQPVRVTYFAGVGLFLPRIEERDATTRNAAKLSVGHSEPVNDEVRNIINKILGSSSDSAVNQEVKVNGKNSKVFVVARGTASYSELHMGSGEGRIYHIVRALENLPNKSLVVLEEPETSLHPSAQFRFGEYLVDLAIRKRHQIFVTSHSEFLLSALPKESRLFLMRGDQGIVVTPKISARQATSLMADSKIKAFHVLVEDDVAQQIVISLLQKHEPFLLRVAEVVIAGDKTKIHSVMSTLADQNLSIIAIRDGDFGDDKKLKMYKLFGTLPPEKEIFQCPEVAQYLLREHQFNLEDAWPSIVDKDHHQWFAEVSHRIGISRTSLIDETVDVYLEAVPIPDRLNLIETIKKSLI